MPLGTTSFRRKADTNERCCTVGANDVLRNDVGYAQRSCASRKWTVTVRLYAEMLLIFSRKCDIIISRKVVTAWQS